MPRRMVHPSVAKRTRWFDAELSAAYDGPSNSRGKLVLSIEENEILCRVGPGTVMGNFMRQYWIPALLSSELPAPDSDPVRVLLLGEQLIAFLDSNGAVGLVQN